MAADSGNCTNLLQQPFPVSPQGLILGPNLCFIYNVRLKPHYPELQYLSHSYADYTLLYLHF